MDCWSVDVSILPEVVTDQSDEILRLPIVRLLLTRQDVQGHQVLYSATKWASVKQMWLPL